MTTQTNFFARLTPSVRRLLLAVLPLAVLLTAGCPSTTETPQAVDDFETAAPDPLTALIIGEPEMGQRIARQWRARMDGQLDIIDQAETDWIANDFAIPADVDIIVYPTMFIGQLAEDKKILSIQHSIWNSEDIDKDSMLNHYRRTVVRYGNEPYAVPLGNPHIAMFYRLDKFKAKDVALPKTWAQLEKSLNDIDGKLALPLAEGWAGHAFLCRIAPNVRTRGSFSFLFDRSTMKPLVGSPAFIEALEQLKRISDECSLEHNPQQVFETALQGKSVAAMSWPSAAFQAADDSADDSESNPDADSVQLAIEAVPGSTRYYDARRSAWKDRLQSEEVRVDTFGFSGRLASIVAGGKREGSAIEFIKWVSGKKIGILTSSESEFAGPVRAAHLGDISQWTGDRLTLESSDEYTAVVQSIHEQNIIVVFPRIPGSHRYYDVLDAGVRKAIGGDASAKEAMAEVAAEWEKITEEIGRKKQIDSMRRESGF
jgi:multiple sugar transport system substrate-binding protein